MYNFGKIPPRAIEAAGVASVLGENCLVFYDNLFNSSGLGRVSDLLSARLRSLGLDELKLRALLLFGFFEAYRAQSHEGGLEEPLIIECGMDDEKVAIGVAFALRNPEDFVGDGLQDRISQNHPSNAFESLLSMIFSSSDHTIVRVNESREKVELISLLAIPGKIELGERQPMTIVKLGAAASSESAQAKEYVQLADLEYSELLKDVAHGARKKAVFSTGEILSKRFSAPDSDDSKIVVKGQADEESSQVIVSRTTTDTGSEAVKVEGAKRVVSDQKTLVRGSGEGATGEVAKEDLPIESRRFSVQEMLGKFWPFKRKKKDESVEPQSKIETSSETTSSSDVDAVAVTDPVKAETQAQAAPEASSPAEPEQDDATEIAQMLSKNFATGSFSQFAERTQEMAIEIKQKSTDQAAKRWAEGVSQQIMAEKIRLGELSQKVTQAIRQKQQDLRRREQTFTEDLRRKEEALHQKTVALNRAKDQITQLTAQIERQKGAGGAGEEANFKQKYQLSQRMMTSLREENAKLASKFEELKAQSTTAQKSADSVAHVELANLKSKQDQMMRQNMQLKSLNEQLMRRINQSTAKSSDKQDRAAIEEVKKKLEAATKLNEQHQKEMTLLKSKLDRSSKEETRWMSEMAKKESELRRAKTELERLQALLKSEKAEKAEKSEKKAG